MRQSISGLSVNPRLTPHISTSPTIVDPSYIIPLIIRFAKPGTSAWMSTKADKSLGYSLEIRRVPPKGTLCPRPFTSYSQWSL